MTAGRRETGGTRDAAPSEDFLPARSHALEGSDLIAASLLRNVSSGTYVDVGANHPIRQSNTRHFYEKGWRGLAIDGNGEFEAAWREQRPGDIFVSALVSDKIKSVDFLIYPDRTMSTIDDGSIARYSARYPGQQIQKEVRETVTLYDLKNQYLDQREVHLLSVDVEGEDLNCLVGARLDLWQPGVIIVETKHLSIYRVLENEDLPDLAWLQNDRQDAAGCLLCLPGKRLSRLDSKNDYLSTII